MQEDSCGATREPTSLLEGLEWSTKRILLWPKAHKILTKAVQHLELCTTDTTPTEHPSLWLNMAVLITPSWKGASWWPNVREMRKEHIPLGCLSSEDTMGWQSRNEHAPAWTAFFDGVDDPLWAERTRTRHRNILLRFLVWQEYQGLGTGTNNNKDNKKRENEAKGIARFIRALTREVSGEAIAFERKKSPENAETPHQHKKAESNKDNSSSMAQRRQQAESTKTTSSRGSEYANPERNY